MNIILAALLLLGLSGCGVTKLWGDDDNQVQNTVRPGVSLREQAASLSRPAWKVEEKGSLMSQVAGVLVNGARSAGEALDVFDWTENESSETRQAKSYLKQLSEDGDAAVSHKAVLQDIRDKNSSAATFRTSGIEALDYFHRELDLLDQEPDDSRRKDRTKQLLNQADEDRRAAIQASKSLRLQSSVFDAAGKVLARKDEALNLQDLNSEVGQLRLRAGELRSLAEELDLD